MSTPNTFRIVLGSQPITYEGTPDNIRLRTDGQGTVAEFGLMDIEPYPKAQGKLYLGKMYSPQLKLGNDFAYLQPNSSPNTYSASRNIPTGPTFSMALLSPMTEWNRPIAIGNVRFDSFMPGNAQTFTMQSNGSGTIPISPVSCMGNCQQCGYCPDQFSCTGQRGCVNITGVGPSFGIRGNANGEQVVYTYRVMNDNQAVLAPAKPDFVSADIETDDIVRERYFYADYRQDENYYTAGTTYPIYIVVNGQKRYLSSPQRMDGGASVYTLTSAPQNNTAAFRPTNEVNWRQFSLTPDNFPNLAYTEPRSLALWQDSTLQTDRAVRGQGQTNGPVAPVSATPKNGCGCNGNNTQVTAGLNALLAPFSPVLPLGAQGSQGNINTPTSIWSEWWFWLILAAIAILIIVAIVLLFRRTEPVTTTVVSPTPTRIPATIAIK